MEWWGGGHYATTRERIMTFDWCLGFGVWYNMFENDERQEGGI